MNKITRRNKKQPESLSSVSAAEMIVKPVELGKPFQLSTAEIWVHLSEERLGEIKADGYIPDDEFGEVDPEKEHLQLCEECGGKYDNL